MQTYPNVADCYDDLFCSLELKDVTGVILYREYSDAVGVVHAVSIGVLQANFFFSHRLAF